MTMKAGKNIFLAAAVFSLLLNTAGPLLAGTETMYDYTKIPPFIEVGVDPNLLLLIDNSASMYDQAYSPENKNYCFAGVDGANSYAAYDETKNYAGYFDPAETSWYNAYDPALYGSTYDSEWYPVSELVIEAFCNEDLGKKYSNNSLCLVVDETVNPKQIKFFAAKGRFLNWLASSKFDVEKEILTGGKYDAATGHLIMESRGCLGHRFIKKIDLKDTANATYYATFGIRQADGNDFNTIIDVFPPTANGFSFGPCQQAITAWGALDPSSVNLGNMQTSTQACMEAAGTTYITESQTAFNHVLQECWYFKKFGVWQPGGGTVANMKNDCEAVYNAPAGNNLYPGAAPNLTDYESPGGLTASDVCNGYYDGYDSSTTPSHWGTGYVGQCWEEKYSQPMVAVACPAGSPVSQATAVKDENDYWYYCDGSNYMRCSKNALPSCNAGTWSVWYEPDPNGTPIPDTVYWTNDNNDGGYQCINNALQKYCLEMDEMTVVDSTEVTDVIGTAWGVPAVMVDTAAMAQMGDPLLSLAGKVKVVSGSPKGLIQEFKYNLRIGAMQFNPGAYEECAAVTRGDGTYRASLYDCLADKGDLIKADSLRASDQKDGGRVISYIDDGDTHMVGLVDSINNIAATAWTPLAEAYFEAVGYYAQKNSFRLNPDDYTCDADYDLSLFPAWAPATPYAAGARVSYQWDYDNNGMVDETKLYFTVNGGTSDAAATTIGKDKELAWTPFDPVLAGCQQNNILIITDGGSTADQDPTMTAFVTAGNNDGDSASTYSELIKEAPTGGAFECKTLADLDSVYGSTLLDDLSYYAHHESFSDFFYAPTVNNVDKKKITTHVVSAGRLQDDGTGYDCNPKTQLQQVALNSGTQLRESTDLSELKYNLRMVFESIGGKPSSGSAASVISNSRSGEGAIFQAVFFPSQEDQLGNVITWAGDVHALWLDERGNIREDCGPDSCGAGDQDAHLDKTLDHILQFYTDPISSSARARVFNDADGDGRYDPDNDVPLEDNINLRDIRYVWSAGEWLAQVAEGDVETQRSYGGTGKRRYIVTSLDGANMIAFTPAAVSAGLGSTAYKGYFHAATVDEANDIISYIRGDDTRFFPDGVTPRGYRSRSIDWDEDGTPEIWKLGDVVNSTPTVVSSPAEDYDLIYGDYSYLAFRKRYRNRRAMVYAGGNDGGFHAFNGGFYNRATNTIDKAPPPDTDGATKVAYDLGAEMWMFVPRNLFPHLKWLTDPKYSHVNYVDFKPYIFDAKIFPPDVDHPAGWGTILVGGLGFGGGDIGVNTDGDGADDLTLRSQYFILDITNPEVPPKILGEFTHPNLGFTIGAPTAIPILLCQLKEDCTAKSTAWPMDWYLAFPSGPYHNADVQAALNGISTQFARIFTVPLGGTGGLALANVTAPVGSTYTSFTVDDTTNFQYSFFSDVIAVDHDLDFKTDTLYFGSVAKANGDDPSLHTGGMHRLVIGEAADTLSNPWGLHTFFKTPGNQPVSGAPSVSSDGQRAWIFFGTGRYYSAQQDKANQAQQSYYGLKEQYDAAGVMQLTQLSGANLIDVSDVWVEAGGDLHLTSGTLPLKAYNYSNSPVISADLPAEVITFAKLDKEMSVQDNLGLDKYNGWKLDFDQPGERNLGQAAILGDIVTFTTFVPSEDICQPEGESFLWAPYYRTGTAYLSNVIGTVARDGETEVLRKLSVGHGLASTPNIHTGAEAGSTAFVQTSTGAIISVQQNNPGVVKGGPISWRELGD